jgi:signal transduction histidine kinase
MIEADTEMSRPHRLGVWSAIILLSLAVVLVFAAAWEARRSFAAMNAITDVRSEARTARLMLERVMSLLKDIEAGSRGFVITGRGEYLEPYVFAEGALSAALSLLEERLAAHLPSDIRWDEIEHRIAERRRIAANVVAARREAGAKGGVDEAMLDEGKRSMNALRVLFGRLDRHQDARIDELNVELRDLRRRTDAMSWVAAALTLLLVALAAALLLGERRERQRLEMALRRANDELETKVAQRTADLAAAHDRLAGFAAEQERAIEQERRHLSREVHDQIGQVFTAIRLIAVSLPRESYPAGQHEALQQALDMGIASARRITAELRPPLLDDFGLAAALQHFVRELARAAELQCEVDVRDEQRLSEAQALCLFRITQEAFTNVVRHAAASRIAIGGRGEDAAYLFAIADDGCGFDAATLRAGAVGLAGMRERAALFGGDCRVVSAPGAGCRVEIRLPLSDNARDEHPAG